MSPFLASCFSRRERDRNVRYNGLDRFAFCKYLTPYVSRHSDIKCTRMFVPSNIETVVLYLLSGQISIKSC